MHQVGFIIFQITMEKLLNVEQFFFIKNSFKSKLKIYFFKLGVLLVLLESP